MTGSASDPLEWQPHTGGKARRDLLAKRARDPEDALKIVIVRDMWLIGFDAPCMYTMYVDKPMRGHGLIDILAATGIATPDISILSNAFLHEIQKLDKKNLALEALRKLLAGGSSPAARPM